jgi:DNA uptake protein ComE-like DNA-binding protein
MSLRELFLFTNKEKRGLVVLLLLLVISMVVPVWSGSILVKKPEPTKLFPIETPVVNTDSLSDTQQVPDLFAFNPNVLDSAGWLRLGFTAAQAATVLKYRRNGGHFYQRDDLLKLYFIEKEKYMALRSFIQVDDRRASTAGSSADNIRVDVNDAGEEEWKELPGIGEVLSKRIVAYRDLKGGLDSIPQLLEVYGITESWLSDNRHRLWMSKAPDRSILAEPTPVMRVDINRADSAQLDALPGIGPFVARQIIQYREKLGGFIDTTQLREVRGLREENLRLAMPHLMITSTVRPLSLSNASQQELAMHPYIGSSLAAFIVSYRMRHGGFTSVDELRASFQVDEARLHKLRPYLIP